MAISLGRRGEMLDAPACDGSKEGKLECPMNLFKWLGCLL